MVTNLAGRLIPVIGDLGYDSEAEAAPFLSVLDHPFTHIYSDQGWLRVKDLRLSWFVSRLAEFEAVLGGTNVR